mgnify:CR=1 FL=1
MRSGLDWPCITRSPSCALVPSAHSADKRCAAAESVAADLRQRLEDLSAENRVLQDSVKAMRQECTERWVGSLGLKVPWVRVWDG